MEPRRAATPAPANFRPAALYRISIQDSTTCVLTIFMKILLAFLFTYAYISFPFITGPTCDCLCGHPAGFAKGGTRAMLMKSGQRWHCMNPACGCAVLVEADGKVEGQNPRCACGSDMKKTYSPPVFRHLDLLRSSELALVNPSGRED
jgi:hypothetical protein